MKRLIELDERDLDFAKQLRGMLLEDSNVQQIYKHNTDYITLQIKEKHWGKILKLLCEESGR